MFRRRKGPFTPDRRNKRKERRQRRRLRILVPIVIRSILRDRRMRDFVTTLLVLVALAVALAGIAYLALNGRLL